MAAGVEASIAVQVRAHQQGALTDFGTARAPAALDLLRSFNAGTASDAEANLLYSAETTLGTGATGNLDMAGVLATGLGATITAAEIVAIIIEADAANTTNLTFFGHASAAFNGPLGGTTPTIVAKPGSFFVLTDPDGWAVTATTADLLSVVNGSGASATYRIIIIGRTAAS